MTSIDKSSGGKSEEMIGPVLPVVVDLPTKPDEMYGPALPPGLGRREAAVIGPCMPPPTAAGSSTDDDDDDETIGPLLPSTELDVDTTVLDFESRAAKMKKRLTETDGRELKREEWMTVLPPALSKNFGLGPRTFQRREPLATTGDRSVWTDTPADTAEKQLVDGGRRQQQTEMDVFSRRTQQKYDDEMAKWVDELNSQCGRSDSLVDIHTKKLKRKAKEAEEAERQPRRPFDRDVDLKIGGVDATKRRALVQQSTQLASKFSTGSNQFL